MNTKTLEETSHKLQNVLEIGFTKMLKNSDGVLKVNYAIGEDLGLFICGLDSNKNNIGYIKRIIYNSEPNEPKEVQIYSEATGWSNIRKILGEEQFLMPIFEEHYPHYVNDRNAYLLNLEQTFEEVHEKLQSIRENYELDDVINAIYNYDYYFLQNNISPDEESSVEFWKLLYSYDENGEVIENENVDVVYHDDMIIFVRSERKYKKSDGEMKNYPMGLVIGLDDTPDHFFVHRIERDNRLDDKDYIWKKSDIRDTMGFDMDYTDLDGSNIIPTEERFRLQGNLSVRCHDYDLEYLRVYNNLVTDLKKFLSVIYKDFYLDSLDIQMNNAFLNAKDWKMNCGFFAGELDIYPKADTEMTKVIQSKFDIKESEVRERQANKGIKRLSSNLRKEIVSEIYLDNFSHWILEECSSADIQRMNKKLNLQLHSHVHHVNQNIEPTESAIDLMTNLVNDNNITRTTLHQIVEKHIDSLFNPVSQENLVLGNHGVIAMKANILRDNGLNQLDPNQLQKIVVSKPTPVIIGHDEHKTRQYVFPKGVFEFRFLEGLDTTRFS